jgi:hypothetical protein
MKPQETGMQPKLTIALTPERPARAADLWFQPIATDPSEAVYGIMVATFPKLQVDSA